MYSDFLGLPSFSECSKINGYPRKKLSYIKLQPILVSSLQLKIKMLMCVLLGEGVYSAVALYKKLFIFYREELVVLRVVDIFHVFWISSDYYTFAILGNF